MFVSAKMQAQKSVLLSSSFKRSVGKAHESQPNPLTNLRLLLRSIIWGAFFLLNVCFWQTVGWIKEPFWSDSGDVEIVLFTFLLLPLIPVFVRCFLFLHFSTYFLLCLLIQELHEAMSRTWIKLSEKGQTTW